MRDNMTSEIVGAVTAPRITTALAARLDFKSESIFVWTGAMPIQPLNSGDGLLDGNTFEPLVHGVVVDIGENTMTMNGSNELTVVLNVPAAPDFSIAASQVYPNEFQSRSAVLWRALLIEPADPLGQPMWLFRRIRSGSMDKVEIQADGLSHKFILTIESHAGRISSASNQTYLNQKQYDPSDTSQDYAAAVANGDPAPTKSSVGMAGITNPLGLFAYTVATS